MKRVGNLFEAILDRNNLLLATWKAQRHKRARPEVRDFLANLDINLATISEGLGEETLNLGRFQQFTIRDPKPRIITAPCFVERVIHHAIMNVCEPHFDRWLIADTFACRVGLGRAAALQRAGHFARTHAWFLSMDVRSYFDSISHSTLNELLSRRFKDSRLLKLFDRIISCYRGNLGMGLPIGSLCSQHLANFYLDPLDRFVKETLRKRGYVRYMDDMVIWGESSAELREIQEQCTQFLRDQLQLHLKPSPFINRTRHGLNFLGVRQYTTHRILNRRSRLRFRRLYRRLMTALALDHRTEHELQTRLTSLTAFTTGAGVSSWSFRRHELSCQSVWGHMARNG